MSLAKKFLPLIAVIILSFWAVKPLLNPGFFPVHDDTQVARVFEMSKSLKDGMFPVRWVSDLGFGYGYPIFNFYAPLAYYAGSVFNLAGLDALFATKIMIGLGIVLAGIFMYLFAKELFGEAGGVVASLFYIYAPYHAVDIYVRGDVAEFWAYAFIPLAFYGLWKIYKEKKFINVAIGAAGYAGIILSHNLTAMMVTPFLAVFMLMLIAVSYRKKQTKSSLYLISVLLGGLVVSCFYWLPAISEMKYTNVLSQIGTGGFRYFDNFVCPEQLWSSPWGFGGSAPGCVDGLSFMIGKLHILISIASVILAFLLLFLKKHKGDKERLTIIILLFIGFVFSALMTLEVSKPLWQAIPLMDFFQFPWRFLVMASFFGSVLAGSFIWVIGLFPVKKYLPHLTFEAALILIVLLIAVSMKYFVTSPIKESSSGAYSGIYGSNSGLYTTDYYIKWFASGLTHEYLPKGFIIPKSPAQVSNGKVKIVSGKVLINNLERKPTGYAFTADVINPSSVIVPIAYFPFWHISVDGKAGNYSIGNNGIIFNLPIGKHQIIMKYDQTPVESLSDIISIAGIAILLAGIILQVGKRYGR